MTLFAFCILLCVADGLSTGRALFKRKVGSLEVHVHVDDLASSNHLRVNACKRQLLQHIWSYIQADIIITGPCPLCQYDGHRGKLLASDGNSIDCMFVDRRGSPDVTAKGNKLVSEALAWMSCGSLCCRETRVFNSP